MCVFFSKRLCGCVCGVVRYAWCWVKNELRIVTTVISIILSWHLVGWLCDAEMLFNFKPFQLLYFFFLLSKEFNFYYFISFSSLFFMINSLFARFSIFAPLLFYYDDVARPYVPKRSRSSTVDRRFRFCDAHGPARKLGQTENPTPFSAQFYFFDGKLHNFMRLLFYLPYPSALLPPPNFRPIFDNSKRWANGCSPAYKIFIERHFEKWW